MHATVDCRAVAVFTGYAHLLSLLCDNAAVACMPAFTCCLYTNKCCYVLITLMLISHVLVMLVLSVHVVTRRPRVAVITRDAASVQSQACLL